MQCPDFSPWGEIQQYETLCPGAYSVSTAGHGGVMVQKELAATALSEEARKCGFTDGNYLCFEEDCDAPVALRELMDQKLYIAPVNKQFAPGEYEKLINSSLQIWHKEYWQARQNRMAPGESQSLLTVRPMTKPEMLYSYSQSQQISMQTGFIGHLRADMDTDGKGFFASFFDFNANLKTPDFKADLHTLIDKLRFDPDFGGMLKDRNALAAYCRSHPESLITEGRQDFGVRADTASHVYMLRLNPNKGDYNLYCYCYQKKWMDRHLQHSEKGIRFIDPHYKDLFRLADGDCVRIIPESGQAVDRQCRYIDETHLEVDRNLYHICEFAERMEQSGNKVIPLRNSLPEYCYSYLADTGEMVVLKRGETGYYKTDIPVPDREAAKELVEQCNGKLGVTKPQHEAMKAGSMFGWHTPAADPKNYDKDGIPIKPKKRERGDAR